MADYFTHFSCILELRTADNPHAAVAMCDSLAEVLDRRRL